METTGFIHDTETLIQRTGLDRKFVERCNAELATALDPYRMRGDNNKWLYSSSGLFLFDEISRLKSNSATLPDIERHLISLGITQEPTLESLGNTQEPTFPLSESVAAIQGAHRDVVAAKNESLRLVQEANRRLVEEKERQIGTLNQSIHLLTDGRSPEQIQAERKADSSVIAITRSTSSSVIERGAPGRGASSRSSGPRSLKRVRHLPTVARLVERSQAIWPWESLGRSAQASTIRARSASACAVVGRRAQRRRVSRWSSESVTPTGRRPRGMAVTEGAGCTLIVNGKCPTFSNSDH